MVLYERFGDAEARGSGVQNSQRKTKTTRKSLMFPY